MKEESVDTWILLPPQNLMVSKLTNKQRNTPPQQVHICREHCASHDCHLFFIMFNTNVDFFQEPDLY